MSLSPITAPPPATAPVQAAAGETRFLLQPINWAGYLKLVEILGDHGPKKAYLEGAVEFMTPDFLHEESTYILGRMVSDLIVGLGIPSKGLRSSTFTRAAVEHGVEPDECFYLTNIDQVVGQKKGNLDILPPPDLVVEVEITSSLLDKLKLYAGLSVPEIWRYDGSILTILLLQPDATYAISTTSRAFPFLPVASFVDQLTRYDPANETGWTIAYRAWVRDVVAPLYQG